jgi:hypothetical protein
MVFDEKRVIVEIEREFGVVDKMLDFVFVVF